MCSDNYKSVDIHVYRCFRIIQNCISSDACAVNNVFFLFLLVALSWRKCCALLLGFRNTLRKGQTCAVAGCRPETFSKMTRHWKATHDRILTLQLCMFCQKTFFGKSEALKPVRTKNSMGYRPFTVTNRNFKDPRNSQWPTFYCSEPLITDTENNTPN